MKLAVISDLHLGRHDQADQFGHDDAEFLRFLSHLENNFEKIVLLGDIFETLTSPRPFAHVQELEAARAAHPEIVARFDQANYTYIHGNHDLVAGNFLGAPDQLVIEADGQRLLFTHGHWFDWIVQRARFVSEWCVWMGAWVMRIGFDRVFKFFEKVDGMFLGTTAHSRKSKFQRWAVSLAEERQADIIVTGHTHVGVKTEHGDRLFLNSGSCSKGAFSFLSIDTSSGQYALNTSW